MLKIKIIGAGLAGCEAAHYLLNKGVNVTLVDIKPNGFTPAHKNADFGELVCSNSLKSNDVYGNAAGLLKEELRILNSLVIKAADENKVPAGNALAVNREDFAKQITETLKSYDNLEIACREVKEIDFDEYSIIATGPLTTDGLMTAIGELTDKNLSFFDASAPIVAADSIDMSHAFVGDRYGKGNGDHINCPMNKEEYELFIRELKNAERAKLHDFEDISVFEGCMPVEIMAARGDQTLRFGPLKAAGLDDPSTGRWPYACLQLRREDERGSMYNLVGFQTNLTFGEQKRVFGIIPALKNAEFLRYGVMHRNTFIDSPMTLNADLSAKKSPKTFFAGQITGVEGYVESAYCGLIAAINCYRKACGEEEKLPPTESVGGSLLKYIVMPNKNFQPMSANFGILPPPDVVIRDKAERKRQAAKKSIEAVRKYSKEIL